MIVEAAYNLLFNFLEVVFSAFNLPDFPASVLTIIETITGYLITGIQIVLVFCNKDILFFSVSGVIITLVVLEVVHLVFWILKKIPVFGTN